MAAAASLVGRATEADALLAARDLEYEERNGLRPREQNHRRTLGDALDAWVETIASQKETSTRGEYVRVANTFRDTLGRVSLEDLSRLDVQRYANGQRKTLRHGTVRKHITILQMVLHAAVDWGWISTNAAERISIKADEDPIDVDGLTDDQSNRLLAAAAGRNMEHPAHRRRLDGPAEGRTTRPALAGHRPASSQRAPDARVAFWPAVEFQGATQDQGWPPQLPASTGSR